MNLYRFERQFVKDYASDREALEEAGTWHDDRAAVIEKSINGRWCEHTNPLYHPQHYYGGKDGGWIYPNGMVIEVK